MSRPKSEPAATKSDNTAVAAGISPERVWNSLEIAKLMASLITPLTVVLVGGYIATQARKDNESWLERQKQWEIGVQKRWHEEASAREFQFHEEGVKKAEEWRSDDITRQNDYRKDEISRQQSSQRDARVYDVATRNGATELARITHETERRTVVWDRVVINLGKTARLLRVQIARDRASKVGTSPRLNAETRAELSPLFNSIDDDMTVYGAWFSEDFEHRYERFRQAVSPVLAGVSLDDDWKVACITQLYNDLLVAARQDLMDRTMRRAKSASILPSPSVQLTWTEHKC